MNDLLSKLKGWAPVLLLALVVLAWRARRRPEAPPPPPPPTPAEAPAETSAPAPAAPEPQPEKERPASPAACRASFRFDWAVSELAARGGRAPAEVRRGLAAYAACRAFAADTASDCATLSSLEGMTPLAQECHDQRERLRFWAILGSGAVPPPDVPQCTKYAAPGVSPADFCRKAAVAWQAKGDFCRAMEPVFNDASKKACRPAFDQIRADRFSPEAAKAFGQFDQLMRRHFWHETVPSCDADFPLSPGVVDEQALRLGACRGLFQPARCAGFLEPVQALLCR